MGIDKKTFDSFDLFGREDLAKQLTRRIDENVDRHEEAFVVSLNAKFGTGKTSFLEMWQHFLKEQGNYEVIYINAWKTDFAQDPLLPICSKLDNILQPAGDDSEYLKKALREIAVQWSSRKTGLDVRRILTLLRKKQSLADIGNNLIKDYNAQKNCRENLRKALGTYVKQADKQIIILVDELDRASPDYSVRFLESIKHIFSVKGLCFVLAVDRDKLEDSVKHLYGVLDFDGYYRRFVSREVPFSELGSEAFTAFFERIKKTYPGSVSSLEPTRVAKDFSTIVSWFDLSLRDIERIARILIDFLIVEDNKCLKSETHLSAIIFLIASNIANREETSEKLCNGIMSTGELHEYIKSPKFISANQLHNELMFDICCINMENSPTKGDIQHMRDIYKAYSGVLELSDDDIKYHISKRREWDKGMPYRGNFFRDMCGRLQKFKRFYEAK